MVDLIGILVAVLTAALVYVLLTSVLGLPVIVGLIAAVIVLLAAIPGYSRFQRPRA